MSLTSPVKAVLPRGWISGDIVPISCSWNMYWKIYLSAFLGLGVPDTKRVVLLVVK